MIANPVRGKRLRLFFSIAVVVVLAAGIFAWYLNTPRGYVRRVFASVPQPAGSREVGRELRDWAEGPACPYAQHLAAYATDRPWEEVAAFYQAQLEQNGWGDIDRRVLGIDATTNQAMEQVQARWPFGATKQSELTVTVVNFSQVNELPATSAQTLFTVGIEYIPDLEFFRSSELCQD